MISDHGDGIQPLVLYLLFIPLITNDGDHAHRRKGKLLLLLLLLGHVHLIVVLRVLVALLVPRVNGRGVRPLSIGGMSSSSNSMPYDNSWQSLKGEPTTTCYIKGNRSCYYYYYWH